jgi:uncharacterized membrane protein YfcA
MLAALLSVGAGAVAGCLGTLLGLGGGFLLVPFFQLVLGLPFDTATGLSLIAVIGNSMAVSTARTGRDLLNVRLAVILQVLTVVGASAGAELVRRQVVTEAASQRVFGAVALLVAIVMLQRLDKRNVIAGDVVEVGTFGGRFEDRDTRQQVSYRVKRLPVAAGTSLAAGVVSSLAGVGGGIVVVPSLNSFCGVPLRVAAATSTFILGATALPGALQKFHWGDPSSRSMAAAVVLGVLAGSRAAGWLGARANVRALKILLAVILLALAMKYLTGWGL